jgi:hypothetical protein
VGIGVTFRTGRFWCSRAHWADGPFSTPVAFVINSAHNRLLIDCSAIVAEPDAVLSDQQKVLDWNASTTREFISCFTFQDMNSWKQMTKVVFEIQESLNNMREHARSIEVGVSEIIQVWIVELLTMNSWNICLT